MRRVALPAAAFAILLVAWQAGTTLFAVPSYLLPSPVAIWQAGARLGLALPRNAGATLTTIGLGFALSVAVGGPLGVLVASSPLVAEALTPLLIFAHAIPVIAIAPVIVVVFGTDLTARLIIVVLIAFFPIMVSTASGILGTPRAMLDLAAATGASRWTTLRTVRMPHAVPFLFSGLRIGVTVAVVGAVVSEFVSSDAGLGYLIVSATSHFDVPQAMASVILLAAMSVLLYAAVGLVQDLLFPWSKQAGGDDD